MRRVQGSGYTVKLDPSKQLLRLEIPEDRSYGSRRGQLAAPISPKLQVDSDKFISASVLAQKAKTFDDGLVAAVELAADSGLGRLPGKAELISAAAKELNASDLAQAGMPPQVIFAAEQFQSSPMVVPTSIQSAVKALLEAFQADELRSKPIGLYSWTDRLAAIFRRDRILQSELRGRQGIELLARTLRDNPRIREGYDTHLQLASQMTNQFSGRDLREVVSEIDRKQPVTVEKGIYFFPPSVSHEAELIKRLYGNRPIPPGFDLMEELIRQVQAGNLALRPGQNSGWYDYQTWALEPMVCPEKCRESSNLELDESYRAQLIELFKGILSLTRETHIKQLEIPMAGAAPLQPGIDVYPELSAEPLATYYRRRAIGYRFVRDVIDRAFATGALAKMQRITAEGPQGDTLDAELSDIESLFRGAYLVVSREIGQTPDVSAFSQGINADADAGRFRDWSANIGADEDIGQDVRMMVPIFYDVGRKKVKVWVFLGWSKRPLSVSFARPPQVVEVVDSSGRSVSADRINIAFKSQDCWIDYPVMAETYVTRILSRAEFRALCDRYQQAAEILKHLK
jgi:hypothetical protein